MYFLSSHSFNSIILFTEAFFFILLSFQYYQQYYQQFYGPQPMQQQTQAQAGYVQYPTAAAPQYVYYPQQAFG